MEDRVVELNTFISAMTAHMSGGSYDILQYNGKVKVGEINEQKLKSLKQLLFRICNIHKVKDFKTYCLWYWLYERKDLKISHLNVSIGRYEVERFNRWLEMFSDLSSLKKNLTIESVFDEEYHVLCYNFIADSKFRESLSHDGVNGILTVIINRIHKLVPVFQYLNLLPRSY